MATKKTLYEILGVPRDAMDIDVGLAFQKRMAEIEKQGTADSGEVALLTTARDVLSNAKRRAIYDASLVTAAEKDQAKQQAAAPDLVVEADPDEEEEAPKSKRVVPIAGAAAAIALVIFLVAKFTGRNEAPTQAAAESEKPAAPAKPAPPPPPPKPLGAHQILPYATNAAGQVMSYEMSGAAVPIGLGIATESGTMITTCDGIPAGAQLVVKKDKDLLSATLAITDEEFDLCKLAVAGLNVKPVPVATDEAKAGDKVYVLGVNAKGEYALTEGTVKQVWMAKSVKALELSMPIAANGRGGAVFDQYGNLVGIATKSARFGANVSAAVSASWIPQMRQRDRAR